MAFVFSAKTTNTNEDLIDEHQSLVIQGDLNEF